MAWLCAAGALLTSYLFARRLTRLALWVSLFNQVPWFILGVQAHQPGLWLLAAAFACIDLWGIQRGRGRG